MRRSLLLATAALLASAPLAAQRPGEVTGRVVEAGTGAPVEMAAVEIAELGARARTGPDGRFRLAGVEPGRWRLRVTRAGYAAADAHAEVRAAEDAWVEVRLAPAALTLEAVRVEAEAPDGTAIARAEIERSGARDVGELLARVPGVVVRAASPGGPSTVSIRGSAADEVLVLVDGVPANDPVTGAADLSALPASSVESVTVLPGARSARYGPRAAAGVVLVRTRGGEARRAAALSAGSLGERAAEAEWGSALAGGVLQAGARVREMSGAFVHPRDANDPTPVRRSNADLAEWSAFGAAAGSVLGGELRLRGGWEALERGLPGTGHTPSPHARQEMERGRASLSWRRAGASGAVAAILGGTSQRVRFADSAPPFGLAYDDTTRVRHATARVEVDRIAAGTLLRAWGWGAEGALQRVEAGALDAAPRERVDAGAFAHASGAARLLGREVTLSAGGRVDRDGGTGRLHPTHALTAAAALGSVRLQLAHRSSFAPPSLGDQYFRAGVGVEPNPELGPQRVPGEWEASAAWTGLLRGAEASVRGTAYAGDVRGMVVWLPDFRFRWSPRNVDARRSGGELRAEARIPAAGVRVHGAYALARVTWADPAAGGVQLPYRPRHTGAAGIEVERGGWRLDAAARYTGVRYPAAARLNALPGFWSTSLRAGRDWRLGRWTLTTALDVDRVLDERDALIADFPEPGRRARIDVRVSRTATSPREP
jgi:vitamin B12 transporter